MGANAHNSMLLMLLQACVLQGASITPSVQSNRAEPHLPSSSSRDEGDSHSSGFHETDTSSDDPEDSSNSSWDSDSDDGSNGGVYHPSTRRKQTAARRQSCRTGTAGQAVAAPAAAVVVAAVSTAKVRGFNIDDIFNPHPSSGCARRC